VRSAEYYYDVHSTLVNLNEDGTITIDINTESRVIYLQPPKGGRQIFELHNPFVWPEEKRGAISVRSPCASKK